MDIVEQVDAKGESPSSKDLVNLMHSTQEWLSIIKEEREEELMQAQYMMVSLRDDRTVPFTNITTQPRSRTRLPQPQPQP
jgi:hypothetical protein